MEKISFIIPSRDNLKYLKWAYEGLRKNCSQEHQIVMADDASSDDSFKILKQFSTKYNNLRVFSFDKKKYSQGKKEVLEYGISQAKSDYLVLTDANGNAIQHKNMESLTVGSYSYTEDTSNDTFWNSTEKVVYMYDGGNTSSGELSGFTSSPSSNFSLMGSGGDDYMNLNIDLYLILHLKGDLID